MPQTVEIPGQGIAEFPDEMSPDEIKGVIKTKFFSGPSAVANDSQPRQADAAPPVAEEIKPAPTIGGELAAGRVGSAAMVASQRLSDILGFTQPSSALQVHGEGGRSLLGTNEKIAYNPDDSQAVRAGKAAINVGNEFLAGATNPEGITQFSNPVTGALQLAQIPGQVVTRIKQAEETPAGSAQRWEAGLSTVGLVALPAVVHAIPKVSDILFPKDRPAGEIPADGTYKTPTGTVTLQTNRPSVTETLFPDEKPPVSDSPIAAKANEALAQLRQQTEEGKPNAQEPNAAPNPIPPVESQPVIEQAKGQVQTGNQGNPPAQEVAADPKTFRGPADAFGSEMTPVAQFLANGDGIMSKSTAKKLGTYEGTSAQWDGAQDILSHPTHNKIYKATGDAPADAAQSAFDAGLIKDPSPDTLWSALQHESQTARTVVAEERAQSVAEKTASAEWQDQLKHGEQDPAIALRYGESPAVIVKSPTGEGVELSVLKPNGEPAATETHATIEEALKSAHEQGMRLDDGSEGGQAIREDAGAPPASDANAAATGKTPGAPSQDVGEVPKLRPGEKQGDILSKQTEDLTLAGEAGVDHSARQAAADEAAQAKAESDAANQTQFVMPESSKPADVREAAFKNADTHQQAAGNPVQELGIVPRPSTFVKNDVARVVSGGLKNFVKGYQQIRNILSPASAGEMAQRAAGVVRENAAELARKHQIAATELHDAAKAFSKTSNAFNLDFVDKLESGKGQATPELDKFSTLIRQQLEARVKQVKAINPNALQHVIEDYFPHIWTKESVAKLQGNTSAVPAGNVWGEVFGKRPLEGSKAFMKQRTIPKTIDGVALGLEPVTWNPVELQLLKLHEMDRYVMGQKVLGEYKDSVGAKFVPAGDKAEPGYTQINDKIARVMAPRDWKIVDSKGNEVPGQKLLGHYYAPDDAARIINNYLSPGLRGNVIYDGFRWVGNNMNMVQLGISAYHATFTSLDAATSAFSLGLEQIARSGGSPKEIGVGLGNMAKGTAEAATGVGGLVENLWRGDKFLREYSRPGSTNADLAKIVDAAVAGGARTRMDTFYKTGAVRSFFDAIRQGNYAGAVLRSPFAAIEAASKPLMEYAVPRMKAGIITQQLRYELGKLPANATREDVRIVAGRVVDSVDNRMGQMIYDNLFWNKVLKDGLMASVRSVGWNVGDIREIGGGLVDTLTSPVRLAKSLKGETTASSNPVFTKRMSYVVGLPLIVGAIGSMYQYLMTGKGPDGIQDMYMPRTGRMKADGSEERVMLPTYMKDIAPLAVAGERGVIPLASRAATMAMHKAHPMISTMAQMWENQDYYGNQIRNPDDSFVQSVQKEAVFVAKQWKPFSVQGIQQREGGIKEKAQAAIGIMPAPGELTRTPAMQMIHEINLRKRPAGGYTEAEQQKREDKRAASAGQDLRGPLFKRLSKDDRARVMDAATDEERDIFNSATRSRRR